MLSPEDFMICSNCGWRFWKILGTCPMCGLYKGGWKENA